MPRWCIAPPVVLQKPWVPSARACATELCQAPSGAGWSARQGRADGGRGATCRGRDDGMHCVGCAHEASRTH
jgi:hypothetical protein